MRKNLNSKTKKKSFSPPYKLQKLTARERFTELNLSKFIYAMLQFKVLKKVEKLRCLQCTILRLQSTAETAVKDSVGVIARKYSKPLTTKELKPFKENFLQNLFSGAVNKNIFQYPAVLREEDIHIVLNHSSEVETFLNNNTNCHLNKNTLEELTKLEVFGLSLPQEYGGAGYNETESKFLLECTATVPAVARFLSYNENFGCKILNTFGSETLKKKYLPDLAAGKSFISFAYLESEPIINLADFETHFFFDEENNRYILNGEKKWVHSADKSNLFLVMAKSPKFSDEACKIKFNMILVHKNTPGVTVHKLKFQTAQENDIFEVSFKNVSVPVENVLGDDPDLDGLTILKYGLSHCHIGDSVICLYLVKRLINNAIKFIHEEPVKRHQGLLDDNFAYLSMYAYALESAIYLVTGRFDMYENPDLFDETVLVKVIATDCLQNAIQNCTQIFQRESLKQHWVLEAMKAWHYYSLSEENIEYLKLMTASEGLVRGAPYLSKTANAFLKPYDNPLKVLKWKLTSESARKKYKVKQDFKMELHTTFKITADLLDLTYSKLLWAAEELFIKNGENSLNTEYTVIKFAEASAYLYSSIACLSRASSAVCYEFENFEHEEKIAKAFASFATTKIEELVELEVRNQKFKELYRMIGKATFKWKGYPAEHPLSRTF